MIYRQLITLDCLAHLTAANVGELLRCYAAGDIDLALHSVRYAVCDLRGMVQTLREVRRFLKRIERHAVTDTERF